MAPPATEIAILSISANTTIEDSTSPAGKAWKSVTETVIAQEGCQRVYWGRQVENPNIVDFFVDWDSVGSHKNFIASPAYEPFNETFASVLDGEIVIYHAYFAPHPPSSALNRIPSPTTEYATFYFPSDMSDLERFSWNDIFSDFKDTLAHHAEGFKAVASGWIVEELHHEEVKANAVVYAAVFEWESVESHMKFRETKEFQESIVVLRKASKARQMHHVKFKLAEK